MFTNDVLDPVVPYVRAISGKYLRFVDTCAGKDVYADMLFQTLCYVRETVPTLRAVAETSKSILLRQWLLRHADEERGHDLIFERDYQSLKPAGTNFPISPAVREYIQLARSTAELSDPVSSIFGDMAVMECFPPSRSSVHDLIRRFSVPSSCARGFLLHADVDVSHRNEILMFLNSSDVNLTAVYERSFLVSRLFCRHWEWMIKVHST